MTTSLTREELQLAIQSWLPALTDNQLEAMYVFLHAFAKPQILEAEAAAVSQEPAESEPSPEELRESMFSRISRIVNPAIEPKED